jgi:hypothetical protein
MNSVIWDIEVLFLNVDIPSEKRGRCNTYPNPDRIDSLDVSVAGMCVPHLMRSIYMNSFYSLLGVSMIQNAETLLRLDLPLSSHVSAKGRHVLHVLQVRSGITTFTSSKTRSAMFGLSLKLKASLRTVKHEDLL